MASDQAGEHSTWIVDSGASHNIISNLQNLSLHFEYGGKENIMIDNGNDIPITHVGSIILDSPTTIFSLDNIEDYLYGRKLHLPLLGTKPESMKVEEWAFLDKQVLEVIRLTLSRSVAHNVVKEKTTADLMKALSGMYEKLSANNKVHLMKKLLNLKMVENASIAQHLNEFNTITNQLSSIEIDFDDEIRALIVLASLPNSWEAMMMVVSNSTGKEKLKYNDIRDLILAEEIRRRYAGETSGSSFALNLETRGRGNDRNSNQGRSKSRNSNRNISKSRSSQQVQCWNCGKTGHFKRQCKNPKKKNEDDSANIVTEEVYLVDGSALDVVGLGDVQISLPNEFVWLLEKKAMVETETGLKVKCLRSDNGGEYIDRRFSEYCAAQGIRMEKTIPGTPQQNGVAERMNRTLNERARSMRLHVGLPKTFWADAVSTTAYLINRGPSVPMEFRLPEEVWSDKNVKFSHLKVFGCVSYVHIDSNARSKLDAKSKICFFIGYGDEKFGYRFWDEQNRKIIRSRNVIFNEQVMYKDRSTIVSDITEMDKKKYEFVNLDELTKSTVQKWSEEDKENVNSQVDLSTPVAEVRRSSRNIRPPQRYSPVLNYLLLTDGGEPECYDEALQDENSSKLVLGMVVAENLHLEQLDVKTTFLYGDLEEDLYMIQPEGFIVQRQENLVCKLRKRLFNMNEVKPVSTPLGSHFKLSKEQSPKTEEERDHINKVPYASAIGSLMYAMVCTRLDIAHAVGVVSRFMSRPGKQHWEAVKWILRYLKGSLDTCLCFTSASLKLQGYVDVDFAGDIDSRKKAEYVVAIEAGKEMIWLHGFLDELGKKQEMGILHSDSQNAIFLAKNLTFHSKSKHIQTKYHFIRYLVEDKLVILEKICGSKNPADMSTKGRVSLLRS
uniref:Retrovirus-related Pol polyprotein from transposon TNT 1-94 n=1 Tax=Vitis vinifera TaxID=29760 RepID=A5AQV5_VITVI|nr:hypothetical protein VITISV_041785 [Vitis vinifera]